MFVRGKKGTQNENECNNEKGLKIILCVKYII
jgi:hypothetical protein